MMRSTRRNARLLMAALVVAMMAECGDEGKPAQPVTYSGSFSGSGTVPRPPGCTSTTGAPNFGVVDLTGSGTFDFIPSSGGGFTLEGWLSLTSSDPECLPSVLTVDCSGSATGGEATFRCNLRSPVTAPLDGSGTYDGTTFSGNWGVVSGTWAGRDLRGPQPQCR